MGHNAYKDVDKFPTGAYCSTERMHYGRYLEIVQSGGSWVKAWNDDNIMWKYLIQQIFLMYSGGNDEWSTRKSKEAPEENVLVDIEETEEKKMLKSWSKRRRAIEIRSDNQEELENYSENVQKRINQLTRRENKLWRGDLCF